MNKAGLKELAIEMGPRLLAHGISFDADTRKMQSSIGVMYLGENWSEAECVDVMERVIKAVTLASTYPRAKVLETELPDIV